MTMAPLWTSFLERAQEGPQSGGTCQGQASRTANAPPDPTPVVQELVADGVGSPENVAQLVALMRGTTHRNGPMA